MQKKQDGRSEIPYYEDINHFLASVPVDQRTDDPLFYCFRLDKTKTQPLFKPPFRRGFYFVGLLTAAEKTKISFDNTSVNNLDSLIVFQSPGLIYSFYRDQATHGYLIYFKSSCFSYFKPSFEDEFPFFNIQHTDFYRIDHQKFQELLTPFEEVFTAYEKSKDHTVASLKLLSLLYELKDLSIITDIWQSRMASPQQILLKNFINLINTHYLEKKKVADYAALLRVTSNHLSQSVKAASGKNALSYITDRLVAEARSLINYTHLSMAEIAYKLDFSDPANFGKFFKKHTGITPQELRRKDAPGN